MMTLLESYLREYPIWLFAQLEYLLLIFAPLVLLELLLPKEKFDWVSRVRGALYWTAYTALTIAAVQGFWLLWKELEIEPLFTIDLTKASESIPEPAQPLLFVLASWGLLQISGFFYYWLHRLQHSARSLWNFHSEHHSIRDMNALNSWHHWSEEYLRIPFVLAPTSLVVQAHNPEVPLLWATLIAAQGIYEHSNTKLHFGFLRVILPDNRFHRIHHSRREEHWNKNFGSETLIWDWIFQTIHWPSRGEWPQVGLSGKDEPKGLLNYLLRPLKRQ